MFRLNHLFKRADAVQRHLAAPLARSRLAYLAHRAEQGARSSTLRGIAALQVKVIHYLELGEQGKVARPDIEAAARRWVSQDPARRGGNADIAQRHFVSHATCWLRFAGRLEDSAISTHPHSGEVADFVDYMRQERGWSEATIRDRRARADDFLRRFCARTGALAEATIATIDRALSENNARTGRPRCRTTIRTHADALRAFFRFAEDRGWSRPGVAAAIVAPRVYRDAALPVGPSWGEQRLLLASTEGDCPADLRDRALLLMLSAYGLRAGEVCALQLDDIDWEAETLRVRRPKTGRVDVPVVAPRRRGPCTLPPSRPTSYRCPEDLSCAHGANPSPQRLRDIERRAKPYAALRHQVPASRSTRVTPRLRTASIGRGIPDAGDRGLPRTAAWTRPRCTPRSPSPACVK